MKSLLSILFFIFITGVCFSQYTHVEIPFNLQTDSVPQIQEVDELAAHSPKTATIRSALLPGLGQAYNHKFWKIPIIYAGLGTCVYFIIDNNKNYVLWRDALFASDGTTVELDGKTYSYTNAASAMDTYRQWLDISYMCLLGVYLLNIIDANVDAHLFYFDVGEEASLNFRPYFNFSTQQQTGLSFQLNF